MHAEVVDVDEPPDVEGVRYDLVVIDEFVVADVAKQLALNAAADVTGAAEHAGRHEVAVEGPGLDDDRRPRARSGVVEVVPHLLPLRHDRERGVLGLLPGEVAEVGSLFRR